MTFQSSSDDRLIIALDVTDAKAGIELVDRLGDGFEFFKIGLGMLATGGLSLADDLKRIHGKRVFLDMKFFDIGATVTAAVRGLSQIEPDFLTVHGDPYVVEAAVKGRGQTKTSILAITVMSSLDRSDLDSALICPGSIESIVADRSRRAFAAGADGVICSPREARTVRSLPEASDKLIVTPGVRPNGTSEDDQKRTETPEFAITEGANHIVVGRPITRAKNPRKAAAEILASLPAPTMG